MITLNKLREEYYLSPDSMPKSAAPVYNKKSLPDTDSQTSEKDRLELENLKKQDAEVKQHERDHITAGGAFIQGGANYTFTIGPDGKRYAVAGNVNIDTGEVPGDPAATIRKANAIRKAALAPAHPSAQDLRVAAEASEMARKAQSELRNTTAAEANPYLQAYNSDHQLHSSSFSAIM